MSTQSKSSSWLCQSCLFVNTTTCLTSSMRKGAVFEQCRECSVPRSLSSTYKVHGARLYYAEDRQGRNSFLSCSSSSKGQTLQDILIPSWASFKLTKAKTETNECRKKRCYIRDKKVQLIALESSSIV